MSALSKSADLIATKLVTSFPDNAAFPKIQSTIMLHSPENGSLLAVGGLTICYLLVQNDTVNRYVLM